MRELFYSHVPDAGYTFGSPFPVDPAGGPASYAGYRPPTRYAASYGQLVDAEAQYGGTDEREVPSPRAFDMVRELFWRMVGLNNTSSDTGGLVEVYEPGTRPEHTPDPAGMIGYAPSIRSARPGSFATHMRPTLNVVINKALRHAGPGSRAAYVPSGKPPTPDSGVRRFPMRPSGVFSRVTSWPKAVPEFRPFSRG